MRGADAGPWSRLCALPALWTGVLYEDSALDAAWDLCKDWSVESHEGLRAQVARSGLKAQVGGRTVQEIARDMLAIAHDGLKARNRLSGGLVDETNYLADLEEIVETGMTPAERLLQLYEGPWNRDMAKVYDAMAF